MMSAQNGGSEPEIIPPGTHGSHESSGFEAGGNAQAKPSMDFDDVKGFVNTPLAMPRLTYALYAIASISGFPMLIGLILAYVARSEASPWLHSHYTFLIRTFWGGLLLILVGVLTFVFGVGMFMLWVLPLWYVIRIVRGWVLLENNQFIPNPKSLLFG